MFLASQGTWSSGFRANFDAYTGVPGGLILTISRSTFEIEVVGSNLARDAFLPIDGPKARQRDNSMRIDEHIKLKIRNAEPYA